MSGLIHIDGATATLSGMTTPAAHLKECLSFWHPGRFYSRAFRDGRWDGRVNLARGNEFPAGFARRVRKHLRRKGIEVSIRSTGSAPIDASRFDGDYLTGIKMWPHQIEAVHAMLANPRGVLKEPTGSGKSAMMAAAARMFWEECGWRSLVVVPKKGLVTQTQAAFSAFYDDEITVGIAGDGIREEGPITIATAQTLAHFLPRTVNRKAKNGRKAWREHYDGDEWLIDLLANTDVLFLDECHHTSSDSWNKIADACPAKRRYGLSGTPLQDRTLNDVKLEGSTGPIIHSSDSVGLIRDGLSAKPKIVMVTSENASDKLARVPYATKTGKPKMRAPAYRDAYQSAIVNSPKHNRAVVASVMWLLRNKRRVLVLCRLKAHFLKLAEMLQEDGIEAACLWGNSHTEERDEAKQMFASGMIRCILATTIFDEGEDVKGIDAIVLAEGVSANTSALQRIGRGMRRDSSDVWVVDIVPIGSDVLIEHAARRCDVYEKEGYEVVVLDRWPKSLRRIPPADLLPFNAWEVAVASD